MTAAPFQTRMVLGSLVTNASTSGVMDKMNKKRRGTEFRLSRVLYKESE